MIWGYIFITLIVGTAGYVLWVGDQDARLAILTLLGGSAATVIVVYLSGQYFLSAYSAVALVDFAVFAVFLWQALRSRRYWMLPLPALQLIACITHIAKFIAPDIVPRAYAAAQGHWSYYQIVLIASAAYMHGRRRKLLRTWLTRRSSAGSGHHA